MRIENNTVFIHLTSTGWSVEDFIYAICLDDIIVYDGAPQDKIEQAIMALMLYKTHRPSVLQAGLRSPHIHTSMMRILHKPLDVSESMSEDDVHARIDINNSAISINAIREDGSSWSARVVRNYFSMIAGVQCLHTPDLGKSTLAKNAAQERDSMKNHTYISHASAFLHNEICFEHAILCAIISHAYHHDLPFPHHTVLSYFLDIATKARRDVLQIERSGNSLTNAPISDYFLSQYISWAGLTRPRHIVIGEGFDAYQQAFPKSWRDLGAALAPLAFKIEESVVHHRVATLCQEQDLQVSLSVWAFNDSLICQPTSHQRMGIAMIESNIISLIKEHEGVLHLDNAS